MDFPTLSQKPDGETFKVSIENPAIEPQNTDGGYLITRPKYTRAPPRTFMFQFSDISQDDRTTLDTFFSTQAKGSSVAFDWADPTSGTVYNVRFSKGFILEFDRTGYGSNHRYDTNMISLTEV